MVFKVQESEAIYLQVKMFNLVALGKKNRKVALFFKIRLTIFSFKKPSPSPC
jgi:hypothetical protein